MQSRVTLSSDGAWQTRQPTVASQRASFKSEIIPTETRRCVVENGKPSTSRVRSPAVQAAPICAAEVNHKRLSRELVCAIVMPACNDAIVVSGGEKCLACVTQRVTRLFSTCGNASVYRARQDKTIIFSALFLCISL